MAHYGDPLKQEIFEAIERWFEEYPRSVVIETIFECIAYFVKRYGVDRTED